MIDITEHCWNLSRIAVGETEGDCYRQVYEYLNIAAGIEKIEIDLHRYDRLFGWCSPLDNYGLSREEILGNYISKLTVFTYAWGALEALVDQVKPKTSPQKGKINDICYFLKQHLHPGDTVPCYEILLERLYTLSKNSDANELNIIDRFNSHKHISIHGLGIYVVYKLRNSFAHGALSFPEPEPYEHKPVSSYPELVSVATRITLLTMQMILLVELGGKQLYTNEHFELFGEDNIPVEEALRVLHLKRHKNENLL